MSEPTRIGDLLKGALGPAEPSDPFDLEALRVDASDVKVARPSQHVADAVSAHPRIALSRCASEKEFASKVLGCLEPWFKVDREVTGTHAYGKRVRIDAVLQPLDPAGWFDPEPTFGVEFKQPDDGDTNNGMRLAAQAIDYTYVNWSGYGRLGVFICTPGEGAFPPVGGWKNQSFVMAHLLGQFAVGEVCYLGGLPPKPGWTLLIHGHHRLWSEGRGLEEARRRTIRPKVGSR